MKDRTLLMIPGPIEVEPAVLAAHAAPPTSHLDPRFLEAFSRALVGLRVLFGAPDGQPFVLAGTGTLAMDSAASNLVEPGDAVVVVNTGYFGDRFGAIFERYGAQVEHVRAAVGDRPEAADLRAALSAAKGPVKLVAITHVDTSTGVLTDVPGLARVAREHGALVIVDGVCSIAGEALDMSAHEVDLALTASQKAVGLPPGLALLMAGPRAMEAFRARRTPPGSYYSDWAHWLPIMEAYEARRPAYFATPAVNLVWALDTSLGLILREGMTARWARHQRVAMACRAGLAALGLGQVPVRAEIAANTMSAPRLPAGVSAQDLLPRVAAAGATLAGGLHASIRREYFRIGHMGACGPGDVLATLGALETGLAACGYRFERGAGVKAAAGIGE
ncbi:MAG TPA: alanine--glyoxylate aminotransferase family protein [Candidatus Polarisedimenticolaceae bacterium]|nr:alanine--glyoxylate aminotransferase family protein [Candidatus Polarisedimenticolaceae bacterium]